jgi:hypothetical protein
MKRGTGKGIEFLRKHMADADGPCLIWPFCRDNHGYGQGGINGENFKAHKKMCELVNGPRPSPKHQASHSCGNGHGGCVHPRHLSWKTGAQNQLDRRKHGTAGTNKYGRNGKVTVEIARQVLLLRGKETQDATARRFDISKPTVRNIYKGKSRAAKEAARQLAA